MESILETKAAAILEFFAGLRGTLWVTFEEGTWAAWLYDLLKPHVAKLVVCNPRKNALLKHGNKSDRVDAHYVSIVSRIKMRLGDSVPSMTKLAPAPQLLIDPPGSKSSQIEAVHLELQR